LPSCNHSTAVSSEVSAGRERSLPAEFFQDGARQQRQQEASSSERNQARKQIKVKAKTFETQAAKARTETRSQPQGKTKTFRYTPETTFMRPTPKPETCREKNPSNRSSKNHTAKSTGFSLIELLVVVAIILIIAAIAIPNLLRSKMAANEASAVGSMRTINTASVAYSTSYGGYPPTLAALGPIAAGGTASSGLADLVDNVLGADPATKSGYIFTYVAGTPVGTFIPTYTLTGTPTSPGVTGQRYFFTDQSGVIRQDSAAAATVASAPLQ
jgi:prepilin-type N-terminal cleavage/methylation domain-containing protein